LIRIFRDKSPLLLALLLLLAVALQLHLFLFGSPPAVPAPAGAFSHLFFVLIARLPFPAGTTQAVAASLLLLGQAFYFNYITGKYKLIPHSNYLPALCYLLFSAWLNTFQQLSAGLLCNGVLLILLDQVFYVYRKEKANDTLFNIGFFMAMAYLFNQDAVVFVLFLFAGLLFVRPFYLREWLLILTGMATLLFLTGVWFFWNDRLADWLAQIQCRLTLPFDARGIGRTELFLKSGLAAGLILIAVGNVYQQFNKVVVQTRIYYSVVVWFFIAGLAVVFLHPVLTPAAFYWLILPVSLAAAYWFSEVKRVIFAEIWFICLILTLVFYQFFNRG